MLAYVSLLQMRSIEARLHVPVEKQQLYPFLWRQNKTRRPGPELPKSARHEELHQILQVGLYCHVYGACVFGKCAVAIIHPT